MTTLAPETPVHDLPGLEVLDHDGDGHTDALEVRAFTAGTSSTAARAASWSDYEWATWLPAVLRAAGLPVIVAAGFEHNGRPRSVGPFAPRGLMLHYDASPAGPTPGNAGFIGRTGRPAEGIPAPLSQAWVCVGCAGAHQVGTWHLLAAGRANHAGTGQWGKVARDAGNTALLGVEVDHTAGEEWAPALLASLRTGSAAILGHLGSDPADWLCGHKEYAPGRKMDPDLNMDLFRGAVARILGGEKPTRPTAPGTGPKPAQGLRPFPGPTHFRVGHASPFVTQLERLLIAVDCLPADATPAPLYDNRTRAAVRRFQESRAELRGDADGFPGPVTWRLLQVSARAR